jgi:glutathione S-transferase
MNLFDSPVICEYLDNLHKAASSCRARAATAG